MRSIGLLIGLLYRCWYIVTDISSIHLRLVYGLRACASYMVTRSGIVNQKQEQQKWQTAIEVKAEHVEWPMMLQGRIPLPKPLSTVIHGNVAQNCRGWKQIGSPIRSCLTWGDTRENTALQHSSIVSDQTHWVYTIPYRSSQKQRKRHGPSHEAHGEALYRWDKCYIRKISNEPESTAGKWNVSPIPHRAQRTSKTYQYDRMADELIRDGIVAGITTTRYGNSFWKKTWHYRNALICVEQARWRNITWERWTARTYQSTRCRRRRGRGLQQGIW